MKVLWLFLVIGFTGAFANIFRQNDSRIHGENGWYVPQQLEGSYVWVDKKEAESYMESMESINKFRSSLSRVSFYLYTKNNPRNGIKITANSKSINESNFNAAHPTRFVIHGWTQSYLSGMNKEIRDAWLRSGEYNIIIVDWSRARSVVYMTSVSAVPEVGRQVANFIDFLANNYQMSLDTLSIAGHSLGAHVAGYAGKNVKSGQIHSIVGLDPALPLFDYNKPTERLSNTDAFYVESIHTNGGELGFLKPIGKAAFYPNGGRSQPGCPLDVAGVCAHSRSVTYYAESIAHDNFGSIKCKSYKDAVSRNCSAPYSSVRMGADKNPYILSGEFYTPVNKRAPFGILSLTKQNS